MPTPYATCVALETLLDPPDATDAPALLALDAFVRETLTEERSAALDAAGAFPAAELDALTRGEVGLAMVPAEEGGALCWSRLMRVCARLAAHDLGFTLCLGGAVLGALPVLVAGDAAQRRRFFDSVRAGGLGGLGLSEWDHGSDLLGNATVATPTPGGGFLLSGEKRPINNASRARHLVVLARTGAADDPFGASLFLLDREAHALGSAPSPWMGYGGLDLGSVVLDGVRVGPEALLGKAGEGFVHTRRTLEISRSGVASMAVGAAAAAFGLAFDHARERVLYGAPIGELGGVRRLVARCFARAVACAALGRRAAQETGRAAVSARGLTCAAKLACPRLVEENVADAGVVLGARSLMAGLRFARLRRDAPVLGIFDGSSQLMLDEMWRHVARWPTAARLDPAGLREGLASAVADRPARFDPHAEEGARLGAATGASTLGALAPALPEVPLGPLAEAAEVLVDLAQAARGAPQAHRFLLGEVAALPCAVAALAELTAVADADRRARLVPALDLMARLAAPQVAAGLATLSPARPPVTALTGHLLALGAGLEHAEARAFEAASSIMEA